MLSSTAASGEELRLDLQIIAPAEGIEPGEVFHIELFATGEGAGPALFPDPLDLGPELLVLGFETEDDFGQKIFRRTYNVLALGEGRLILPPVKAAGQPETRFFSRGFELHVKVPELPQDLSVREPDLLRIPAPRGKAWHGMMLGLALLAVACVLGWFYLQRSKARMVQADEAPSAEEIALAGLSRLEAALPESAEQVDRFYVALSRIMRRFIQDRTGIPALERTKEEISEAFEERSVLSGRLGRRLIDLLRVCDRIKFAGFERSAERVVKDLEEAGDLVRIAREDRVQEASAIEPKHGGLDP
jgi:hypothetical protein